MRADYLDISVDYVRSLGGLRWSDETDAIEYADGQTFAFKQEIHAFLEGFGSQGPLVHFGHVLHFLFLLRQGSTPRHDFSRLNQAWLAAGRPGRMAGVVAARLCREVPAVSTPFPVVYVALENEGTIEHLSNHVVEDVPPLDPEVFEALVICELERYSFDQLVHWFRHGHPSLDQHGEELAEEILAVKPRSLTSVLAEISTHERLCGAVPFVARLVGALSLPPRRLLAPELPLGGYSDVHTRGQPEQILPGQFALDELEFLRRHAEKELLYYRREEPGSRTREELVLLMDQGIRTWGRVRLALAAAVLALGTLAQARRLDLRVATTSNRGEAIDPLAISSGELADLLATSDFSPTPALALEALLETPTEIPRDVVLLTGSRALACPDVAAAARRLAPTSRLFAVVVAASGEIGFHEYRRGAPVSLSRFRLELDAPSPAPLRRPGATWAGSLEPLGYPFRFGLSATFDGPLFAFDQAGEWLLLAGQHGFLMTVRTDGSGHEMLPRALIQGQLLTDVHQVIGVVDGFVVVGAVPERFVAVYYHFSDRSCQVFEFDIPPGRRDDVEWRYLRRHHLLVVRARDQFHRVHLPTGHRDAPVADHLRWKPPVHPPSRVFQPLPWQEGGVPRSPAESWPNPRLHFETGSGFLCPLDTVPPWQPFTPRNSGEPVLAGLTLTRAECRQDSLAVLFTRADYQKHLWLFAGPDGRPLDNLVLPYSHDGFVLSSDGRLLAVQRGSGQLQIRKVQPGLEVRCVTPVGRYHNNLAVDLGEKLLVLHIDRTAHVLRWETGELIVHLTQDDPSPRRGPSPLPIRALPGRLPGFLRHDRGRFRMAAWHNLIAVVSVFGEVFLFEQTGDVVCGVFAFRHNLAAWLPDGTVAGPEALLGKPPAPDAGRKIGQALLAAWERGEKTVS